MGSKTMLWLLFASSFAQAETSKNYIAEHAIEVDASLELPFDVFDPYRIVAIGEVHGNDKSPFFVSQLVSSLSARNQVLVGLEILAENQTGIDLFLKTGDFEILRQLPHFKREFQDGRSSVAIARLLDSLRHMKNVSVVAYDSMATSAQDRDTKMARNIIASAKLHPNAKIVLLAGNYHMAIKVGTPFDPNYRPAALELVSLEESPFETKDIFPIYIRYSKGSSWVCYTDNANECGSKSFDGESNYSLAIPSNQYFLPEPSMTEDGYLGSMFLRYVEASPPLIN